MASPETKRVLFWCFADFRQVLEVPADATEDDLRETWDDLMGCADSGWDELDDDDPPAPSEGEEVDHGEG